MNIINISEKVTKDVISAYAKELIDSIYEGNVNALDIAVRVKFMEDVITSIKDKLRDSVIEQCSKYQKGEDIVHYNGEFAIKEAGVKYDYTNCNDPELNDIVKEIERLTELRKEREKFLRAIKTSITTCCELTGEVITLFPPIKSSTTTYSIKWKE